MNHTKPDIVSQPFPKPRATAQRQLTNENHFVDTYFINDRANARLSKMTNEQKHERKGIYKKYAKEFKRQHKFSNTELEKLMLDCTQIIGNGSVKEEENLYEDGKSSFFTTPRDIIF